LVAATAPTPYNLTESETSSEAINSAESENSVAILPEFNGVMESLAATTVPDALQSDGIENLFRSD
jgi:hypothetical protein